MCNRYFNIFLVLLCYVIVVPIEGIADDYIGSEVCADCHQQQYQQWQQSHHYKAMEEATSETVLANFDNQTFIHHDKKTLFFKNEDEYLVNTINAHGYTQTFTIDYVFGVYPLQQYLIGFDDGRYQALTIAWDSRAKEEGGQRWFHLYDEDISHDDNLHWTSSFFNWNSRCANCHSTNLEKNYDFENDRYNTRWSEINVGCEACHGMAKQHVEFKRDKLINNADITSDNNTDMLKVSMDTCGHCHSIRSDLVEKPLGHSFYNAYQTRLLDNELYHLDGQIKEEVYVYDSFKQSKMYANGVTCIDCHNPHSGELKIQGNGLCLQCHEAKRYDTTLHHHHENSEGAQCINCHAPETTYMQIDPRRDHSFRIPRPDWSAQYDVPNACTQCHTQQTNDWALQALTNWKVRLPNEKRIANSLPELIKLATDNRFNSIVRASALQNLAQFPDRQSYQLAVQQLQSKVPEIRLAALRALSFVPLQQRSFLLTYMQDPIKAVRMELAQLLMGFPRANIAQQQIAIYDALLSEYKQVLLLNADFPEGLLNLANYYRSQQQMSHAVDAVHKAIKLAPYYLPSYIVLADNYRAMGNDTKARKYLEKAIIIEPKHAETYYWLGLLWFRQKDIGKATDNLRQARDLAPDNVQYVYAYSAVLEKDKKFKKAMTVLKQGLKYHPKNPLLQKALAQLSN